MNLGIYLNAAGALAAENRIDVIANNLANVDTPGFKRGFAIFQQRAMEAAEPPRIETGRDRPLDRVGGGLLLQEVSFSPDPGPLETTGEPLDLALEGDGWFTVGGPKGEPLYTRAGNFGRRADGTLVTSTGHALLDQKGKPIVVPDGELQIAPDGEIRVDGKSIAALQIRGAADARQFAPVGDNLYRFLGDGEPAPSNATVRQGALESSNVQPVMEMVAMIRTYRAYEANQRMIQYQDQAYGRAANDVGRVSA